MRISSISNDFNGLKQITLDGTNEELEAFEAMVAGACYLKLDKDKVVRLPIHFEPILKPDPETEHHFPPVEASGMRKMEGYWGVHQLELVKMDGKELEGPAAPHGCGTSIYVTGLFGYGCDNPEDRMRLMRDAGFQLLRSPRDKSGKFWEVWYLPSCYFASGPLKGVNLKGILNWLARLGPGSIELAYQHMGLGID